MGLKEKKLLKAEQNKGNALLKKETRSNAGLHSVNVIGKNYKKVRY